jgi:serine/threonine-protein kinase HipA
MNCRITLNPIQKKVYEFYDQAALTRFLGPKTSPILAFSRAQFHLEAPKKSLRMSISGMQPKLSLAIHPKTKELELTDVGGMWILKPSPMEYPYAAENEHCAMLSGKLFGIEMAECGLLEFAGGELAYATRRFDRQAGVRLPQEDLLQCMGRASDQKYSGSYEEAGLALREICGGRMVVIRDYFLRLLHSFVIGNDDLHLKNLSVTRSLGSLGPGYEKLSPHYDVLFARAFENVSMFHEMALDLMQEEAEEGLTEHSRLYGFYTGMDWIRLGVKLGLPEPTCRKIVGGSIEKLPLLLDLIQRSYMPASMQQKAMDICTQRFQQLKMGLK